jgi:hypothetical protein
MSIRWLVWVGSENKLIKIFIEEQKQKMNLNNVNSGSIHYSTRMNIEYGKSASIDHPMSMHKK